MASNSSALNKGMIFTAAAYLVGCRGGSHAFRSALPMPNHSCLVLLPPGYAAPRQARHLPPIAAAGRTNACSRSPSIGRHYSFPSATTRLREQSGEKEIEPTWTYTPYQPPPKRKSRPPRRNFSTESEWTVPDRIPIPEDRLSVSFARSSGAGGQNVNKVETKVELRFHVPSANWIPAEVRDRLRSNEGNRINGEGYMTVTSQEHRTQVKNRKDALRKLEDILRASWARPKVRKMRKGLSKRGKERRREDKKKISMKKENRRSVEF